MATILDELVAGARAEAASRRKQVGMAELESRFRAERRSLAEALRGDGLSVIAEAKKASPSQGVIREAFEPGAIAEMYQEAGASAMSVLTENLRFLGSLDDLAEARYRCELPLLRKDFIVEDYQLFEARAFGADAVLLIATVLDRHHLTDLMQAARELELDCLVELYEESELDRVDFDLCEIIGVNNRDLRTFEVDRMHAPRVLAHVPDGTVRVAESGLRTADDLAVVAEAGIDAVLIGETFMRAEHPGQALKDLREQTHQLLTERAG
ncbi:MAG: indole-3-glycerol phosphate synthase TrpC [Rhodothermales bacterium]|nr:indole-3-glycerol phosphate synthase TrpC [Rhodothermales bacterium]MBO6779664.1 indole-3-glycerol phosphate synthase TrpC [Rhodothermales bacterium]